MLFLGADLCETPFTNLPVTTLCNYQVSSCTLGDDAHAAHASGWESCADLRGRGLGCSCTASVHQKTSAETSAKHQFIGSQEAAWGRPVGPTSRHDDDCRSCTKAQAASHLQLLNHICASLKKKKTSHGSKYILKQLKHTQSKCYNIYIKTVTTKHHQQISII